MVLSLNKMNLKSHRQHYPVQPKTDNIDIQPFCKKNNGYSLSQKVKFSPNYLFFIVIKNATGFIAIYFSQQNDIQNLQKSIGINENLKMTNVI